MFENENFDEIKLNIWNRVVSLDTLNIAEVKKMSENGKGDISLHTSDQIAKRIRGTLLFNLSE